MFSSVNAFRNMPSWLSSRKSEAASTTQRDKKCPAGNDRANAASPVTSSFLITEVTEKAAHAHIEAAIKAHAIDEIKRRYETKHRGSGATKKRPYKTGGKLAAYDAKLKPESTLHRSALPHGQHAKGNIVDITATAAAATAAAAAAGGSDHAGGALFAHHRHQPMLLSKPNGKSTAYPRKANEPEETTMLKRALIDILARVARNLFEQVRGHASSAQNARGDQAASNTLVSTFTALTPVRAPKEQQSEFGVHTVISPVRRSTRLLPKDMEVVAAPIVAETDADILASKQADEARLAQLLREQGFAYLPNKLCR
ncbi:hypothetical protein SYNPS1DRAFT_24938 [Syncephalis pseudoplumigaleata]|uniref:Uncharacterized protein n=1 Tax=Syncephalis pseudoplumigaleata TaxID=1712513 RepID=A0A4P9YT65_9FUNG|nr:hypothetical protein SYNPS1DRAFT_24938 [Syncephalis pseudoplumigaleata]|eukprot:RKP23087.1 hypothetical protein SYNPS1DRAFT_24938 [Syncephalis pseudoplumigaleata]